MGSRGPQPTPSAILKLRGSWRAGLNRAEPQPEPGRPSCPSWLNVEAKKTWRALVPQLHAMKVLTKVDAIALARYCQTFAMWRRAVDFVERHGDAYPVKHRGEILLKTFPQVRHADRLATQLSRLEQAFGLTPAARSRITAPGKEVPSGEDEKRRFLRVV